MLRFVLWSRIWSILVNVPCALAKMCILLIWKGEGKVIQLMSIRSTWMILWLGFLHPYWISAHFFCNFQREALTFSTIFVNCSISTLLFCFMCGCKDIYNCMSSYRMTLIKKSLFLSSNIPCSDVYFYDANISTAALFFFWLIFSWSNFFCSLTFNLPTLLSLKLWVVFCFCFG